MLFQIYFSLLLFVTEFVIKTLGNMMKKFRKAELALFLIPLATLILAGIAGNSRGFRTGLYSAFHPSVNGRRVACQSKLRQITLSVQQYLGDYNAYPLASNSGGTGGWVDAMQPYVKGYTIFFCPEQLDAKVTWPYRSTDYWMNVNVSGLARRTPIRPAATVWIGDGILWSKTNASLKALPPIWLTDEKSPLYRHLDGANFSFLDGHVKWIAVSKIENWNQQQNPFLFR
ncbi:DUF1559 domain-containing protein [bacterium]|nr:MAG: DUF1559 domain-containing protein [bacterium]